MRPLLTLVVIGSLPCAAASSDAFEKKIRPILVKNCYSCHTDSKQGGLRLDSRAGLLAGGKRGPAIEPGKPEASLLIKAVSHQMAGVKMPMGARLAESDIQALKQWIADGAPWAATAVVEPVVSGSKKVITAEN